MKRLGFNSKTTEISGAFLNMAGEWIEKAAETVKLAAVCRIITVECPSGGGVRLTETGDFFGSSKLADLLSGAGRMLLMGITGGSEISAISEELQKSGRMTEAVIFDAAAGEIVDEGFNRLKEIYSRELLREGRRLTSRRFSAGYGDFDISFQKDIFRLLELDKIGIEINDAFILKPEKSVTAIYGITG